MLGAAILGSPVTDKAAFTAIPKDWTWFKTWSHSPCAGPLNSVPQNAFSRICKCQFIVQCRTVVFLQLMTCNWCHWSRQHLIYTLGDWSAFIGYISRRIMTTAYVTWQTEHSWTFSDFSHVMLDYKLALIVMAIRGRHHVSPLTPTNHIVLK